MSVDEAARFLSRKLDTTTLCYFLLSANNHLVNSTVRSERVPNTLVTLVQSRLRDVQSGPQRVKVAAISIRCGCLVVTVDDVTSAIRRMRTQLDTTGNRYLCTPDTNATTVC